MVTDPALGQRIKHYRQLNDMTQAELAAAIGVQAVHITNIERGRRGISLEKLALLCTRLGVGMSDILPVEGRDDAAVIEECIAEIASALRSLDVDQVVMLRTMICSLKR
jgi:transcriptional regulator with XRE-family HTH domain